MIRVTFYYKNEQLVGFKSKGHAGYDRFGRDIICAAVSTLVFTTINAVMELTNDACSVEEDEKKATVSFLVTEIKPSDEASVLLNAFRIGIDSIRKGNSRYLRVISKEV